MTWSKGSGIIYRLSKQFDELRGLPRRLDFWEDGNSWLVGRRRLGVNKVMGAGKQKEVRRKGRRRIAG